MKRLRGVGTGTIFNGSGFYQTDYRSESYKKAVESEKSATGKNTGKKEPSAESKETKSTEKAEAGTKGKKKSA